MIQDLTESFQQLRNNAFHMSLDPASMNNNSKHSLSITIHEELPNYLIPVQLCKKHQQNIIKALEVAEINSKQLELVSEPLEAKELLERLKKQFNLLDRDLNQFQNEMVKIQPQSSSSNLQHLSRAQLLGLKYQTRICENYIWMFQLFLRDSTSKFLRIKIIHSEFIKKSSSISSCSNSISSSTLLSESSKVEKQQQNQPQELLILTASKENIKDQEELERYLDRRSEQIQLLAEDVQQISDKFKKLNQIVITIGTIVDSVDHHVESAQHYTHVASRELVEADEYNKKMCCCSILKWIKYIAGVLFLLIFMVILKLVLLKHS